MSPNLTLHLHPFATFCQKPLVAFYERNVPFTPALVDGEGSRERLAELWPMAKIPVLVDHDTGLVLPESTTVIEYVDALAVGGTPLVPADAAAALQVRLWDRVLDGFVEVPMQKIVADALRPGDERDAYGVAEARATLDQAYATLDAQLSGGGWIASPAFSLADCGAAPALFYARAVHAWDEATHTNLTRYYRELMHRPSVVRVVDEARPYRHYFPLPWPADVDAHQPGSASAVA